MVTKEQLKKMDEASLRNEVLIPLFNAMGFKDVYLYHGGDLERGKDIVMWRETELGTRENFGVVAKAHRITGKVLSGKGSVSEVRTQIEQCFGDLYSDPVDGSEQWIHQCYVVSSHEIKKESIQALRSVLRELGRSTRFIGGDKLWKLVEKCLIQKTLWNHIDDVEEILDSASPYYRPSLLISDGKRKIGIKEKYPGASLDHPIKIVWDIVIPDSAEGREIHKGLDEFYKKGRPIELKSPYIRNVRFPDFITQLMGQPTAPLKLHLKSNPPKEPLPVKIDISPTDGESFSLGYVELIRERVGTEEAFLTNEKQNIPVKCSLTLNVPAKNARIDFRCEFENLNVKQVYDCLCLQNALSKDGAIIITKTDNGLELFNFPIKEGHFEPPSEHWLLLLEYLVFIQTKTNRQITFPTRGITPEEANTVAKVRHILTTGQTNGTWDSFTVNPDRKGVENFLNHVKSTPGQASPLILETEEAVEIFGTEIPLGPVRTFMEQAVLENETQELERFLETATEEDSLQLRFKPHESNRATTSYISWQATAGKSISDTSHDVTRIKDEEFLFRRKIVEIDKGK